MNRRFRFILFIPIFCTAGFEMGNAQLPTNQNRDPTLNPIGSSEIRDTTATEVLPLDTPAAMTYVQITDPDEEHTFEDTFAWSDIEHHPLPFYISHLGNYGSPARTLLPSIDLRKGFFTGWDQYDPYIITIDSFRFYHQEIPIAKIKYSQAHQEDTYLSLEFGRKFAKGLSLSFSYDRINQGDRIPYQFHNQRQRQTALGLGVWHNAPSGRYDGFYCYLANDAVGEENGGVLSPELIGDDVIRNPNIPVLVRSGITTKKNKLFTTKHILHLITDSSDIGIDLWAQGQIGSTLHKYVDDDAGADTLIEQYYGTFLVDDRGIRQFTYLNEYKFTGGITIPWRAARSVLESSLHFRSVDLEQEPLDTRINELFWNASAKFRWIDPLELKGNMSFGLGQASGSFIFQAEASLNTFVAGKLKGHWSIATRNPYMIEDRIFVNQELIYDHDFSKPFTTEFGVELDWEKQSLRAGITWILYDNYIFFNADKFPAQIDESFSLKRFYALKRFDFRWIGLEGEIYWQPDTREELAIPELTYSAALYGRVRIFDRKVILMPGLEVNFHDSFRGISYFPVTGRYHLTDGNPIPEYFRIDAGIGVHINFLKAFLSVDDVEGLFWDKHVLYQVDLYPHYPGYLRIGLEASFFN